MALGTLLGALAAASAAGDEDVDVRALARVAAPPLGLPAVPVPADNPLTAAKVALGRKLFFDRRLSHNRTMSCAMCHIPEQGFTNNEVATPVGVRGRSLPRNAPTTYNVAYQRSMFHDARDTSLENQIFGPLLSPDEMANPSVGFLLETIAGAPDYAGLFEAAFGGPVDVIKLGQALASYQRTVLSGNSPFDRWHFGGESDAVPDAARRGYALFTGKAGCVACHALGERDALFTDHGLHNTGIGYVLVAGRAERKDAVKVELMPGVVVPMKLKRGSGGGARREKDLGRMGITDDPRDLYAFKTPSLRNVALTAPYMHDGSLRTLADVVRFYRDGGTPNPALDPLIRPLDLDDDEVAALVAFLESLTGDDVDELTADARSVAVGN
ncbi:MAG: c-type cytochrome [Gammaproteobacteria bacterium]|nr:c-type cytochrome [Gammaproteobacteria bacterium]MCP5199709.1 c-type cytochrome [Gammaproteobacteria bacterium]